MARDNEATRSAGVHQFAGASPRLRQGCWVAPGAHLVGDVRLGPEVGVFFGAVLRADAGRISVGGGSNLQDNCVLHAAAGLDIEIGSGVSVGHAAIVHGCTIEDDVLIGMGAILMNRSVVRKGSMVAAGALVPQGFDVPPNVLVAGVPARVVRPLRPEEHAAILDGARYYRDLLVELRTAVHRPDGAAFDRPDAGRRPGRVDTVPDRP